MAGGKKRIEKGLPIVVNMVALIVIYAILVFGLVGGDGLYETISQILLSLLVGIHFLEFFFVLSILREDRTRSMLEHFMMVMVFGFIYWKPIKAEVRRRKK